MTILYFLVVISSLTLPTKSAWPLKRESFTQGDLYLMGFFPIHDIDYKLVCGTIEEEGIQQLETFLFAINNINQDPTLLPNITLGAVGHDSCDSSSHALEVAMDSMGWFYGSDPAFRNSMACEGGGTPSQSGAFRRLVGVIGGRSSRVSIQLANLLRVFKVPQVSYKSNAPGLSNKMKYEYFFRTVAPIVHQVKALVEIIKAFGWTYVSVVYSDSEYGNAGFESLQVLAARENICFATEQRVTVETFKMADYDAVLDALIKEKASGVVVFGEQLMARNVFAASVRKNVTDRYVWLGSEAWGSRDYAVKGHEAVAEGTLVVAYIIKPPPGFHEYFRSLTPEKTEQTNPWFYEFWEKKKKCRIWKYPLTPNSENFTQECQGPIPEGEYMQKMPSAQLVRDAVYSVAYALNDVHLDKCGGKPGLCDEMATIDGKELKGYLHKTQFEDDNGNVFQFDRNGDAPPRYSIAQYQKNDDTGVYYWRSVGTYIQSGKNPAILTLERSLIRFKHNKPELPDSICSTECLPGQTKVLLDKNSCCWSCFNCSEYQYISKKGSCQDCPLGYLPTENSTDCREIPATYMSHTDPWRIVCMSFSVVGMLGTIALTVIFSLYWNTPIIKASARELSFLLLFGIFMSFGLTFAILAWPTPATCGVVRFFLGFSYTVCYAAIVTKTRRIAKIFEKRGRRQKHKYTSPQSQLTIAGSLIAIEAVINTTWLMYELPDVQEKFPTRESRDIICKGSDSSSYLLGLVYPFLLMMICTVYAFKTRKCPDGFNEARHITFTNYTTCVIWLAFLPTFILHSSNTVRTATLSLLLSLSGTVQIACLFIPKAYIAMIEPQNNTKELVMGYNTGGTSSSGTTST